MPEESVLEITIRPSKSLTPSEMQEADALDRLAFYEEGGEDNNGDDIQWIEESNYHVMGYVGGRLVSQIILSSQDILAGSQSLRIAGVGGVATHPDWRRLGFARRLLKAAEDLIRSEGGYDFAMLFCDPKMIPYYASCGYIQVLNPIFIIQRGQRVEFVDYQMVLPISGKSWPEGVVDIPGRPW
jgi:GNAT superfamily N-acetyltransferase